MFLYLMRHGIAEERSLTGSDADRELTQHGTLRTAMVAKGFHKLDLEINRIISSPYIRARQTAEIVGRIIGHKDEVQLDARLVPHGAFEEVSDLIGENDDANSILLVGHEPSIGLVISGICARGALTLDVRKASITAIQIDRFRPAASGALLWSIPPRIMEKLSY